MNKEKTLALYEQGSDAWNAWAEKMLADRTALEAAGGVEKRVEGILRGTFIRYGSRFSRI